MCDVLGNGGIILDRTVRHRSLGPHRLLTSVLMWLSVHVSEQCALSHIIDKSLFVA